MAIAGGATVAYVCQVIDGCLDISPVTSQRSLCMKPQGAVLCLERGERVVVAGSDMVTLRALLGVEIGE